MLFVLNFGDMLMITGSDAKDGVEGNGKKTEERRCRYDISKECDSKTARNR